MLEPISQKFVNQKKKKEKKRKEKKKMKYFLWYNSVRLHDEMFSTALPYLFEHQY